MTIINTPRAWNAEHALLRRLLEKDKDYARALETFLSHHAAVHTAKLVPGKHWSFQDEVLDGLTEAQMRFIPKGREHSIVWMLWHITRIEDVTQNILLANSPQVFTSGDWQAKLQVDFVNVGNEMTSAESAVLSETINIKALLAYRLAVGKRTRAIARRLDLTKLSECPAPDRVKRIIAEGAVGAQATWLVNYWGGNPSANLLFMPATRHCFVHLNEIKRMRPKLKQIE